MADKPIKGKAVGNGQTAIALKAMAVYNDLRPTQLPLAQLEVGQKRRRNQPSNQSLQGYSCIQWQAVTDAEINAAASAASNVEFIRDLLAELSLFQHDVHRLPPKRSFSAMIGEIEVSHRLPVLPPTTIYIDSDCVVKLIDRHKVTTTSKNVAIKHYYLSDLVFKGIIKVKWIPTDKNPADIGTKALSPTKFTALTNLLYQGSWLGNPSYVRH